MPAMGVRPGSGQALYGAPGAPALPPGAAGTASTAATNGAQALPVDPAYDAQVGSAAYNLQTGLLGAQFQRGQLGSTFGLGQSVDGTVFDDVSNPYSRAAEQHKQHQRAVRGTQTSGAAQGRLYDGSLQNAQNENARVNDRNRDTLIRQFMGAQQEISQAESGAQGAFLGATAQAEGERIARALANRPLPERVPQAALAAPAATPRATTRPRPRAKPSPKPRNTRSPGRKGS